MHHNNQGPGAGAVNGQLHAHRRLVFQLEWRGRKERCTLVQIADTHWNKVDCRDICDYLVWPRRNQRERRCAKILCRATTSDMASARASTSMSGPMATANTKLYADDAGPSCELNHIRCCAGANGTRLSAARLVSGGRTTTSSAASIQRANARGDGFSKTAPTDTSRPNTEASRPATTVADSESPPDSKKLWLTLTVLPAWCDITAVTNSFCGSERPCVRCGFAEVRVQCAHIHLAVAGERQRIEHDDASRHEVPG